MNQTIQLYCVKHNLALDESGRCSGCGDEARNYFDDITAQYPPGSGGVTFMGGPHDRPFTVKIGPDGEPVDRHHATAYIEWDTVPVTVEDEINEFIRKKVQEATAVCMCISCREDRGEL